MGFASKSYYEILDIDPAASADEVRRSYATVKAAWDPGAIATYSLYSPSESALISRKIEEAFQILIDPERRRRYDTYRAWLGRPPEPAEPRAFWETVHGTDDDPDAGLAGITELLTSGPVAPEEVEAPAAAPAVASDEVEREWGALVGEVLPAEDADEAPEPAATPEERGPRPAWASRMEAATTPPFRAPPDRRTFVSSTVSGLASVVGASWKRPDRGRPATPKVLPERAVSAQQLRTLEAAHGLTGPFLQAVREAKGVALEDIADHTKIGLTYLQDIEREAFESLPPAVYLRGFVLQYVRLLKLDADRVVDAYMARYEAARPSGA